MTQGDRQRRDGTTKRVQLTSGDHSGPKDKKAKRARIQPVGQQQKKAAAAREWKSLFARLAEIKQRDAERQERRGQR